MNDLEQFKSMLDRAGVAYQWDEAKRTIVISSGGDLLNQDKNLGYLNFHAIFEFNTDESLDNVGIWE